MKFPLSLNKQDFPSSLIRIHSVHAENLLRQTLMTKRLTICAAIMQSIGSGKPAIIPVPVSWICLLESNRICVNRIGCKLSLYKYSVFNVLKGIVKAVLLLLHYLSVLNDNDLAREYFFNNSTWLYKLLWSYKAEKKGADVSLYYYSTNMEKFPIGGISKSRF